MKKSIILALLSIFALAFTACDSEQGKSIATLKLAADEINKDLPREMNGVIWQNVEVTDTDWQYNYEVVESDDPEFMDQLDSMKDQFKNMLSNNLKDEYADDEDSKKFLQSLRHSGLGVVYHYKGQDSDKVVDIAFTAEEIAALAPAAESK